MDNFIAGLELRGTHQVMTSNDSGLLGYDAGPTVHVIDMFGVSDPLLAGGPIWTGNRWRVTLRLNLRGAHPAEPS
jgi:hypothetical protein